MASDASFIGIQGRSGWWLGQVATPSGLADRNTTSIITAVWYIMMVYLLTLVHMIIANTLVHFVNQTMTNIQPYWCDCWQCLFVIFVEHYKWISPSWNATIKKQLYILSIGLSGIRHLLQFLILSQIQIISGSSCNHIGPFGINCLPLMNLLITDTLAPLGTKPLRIVIQSLMWFSDICLFVTLYMVIVKR